MPETSGKINKQSSPRPKPINNQNWRETETRLAESLSAYSLETETRHRVSSFTDWKDTVIGVEP